MTNFDDDIWALSDGSIIETAAQEYTAEGGSEPIPEGTHLIAYIDEAKWDNKTHSGTEHKYVSLRWRVQAPEKYKNRVVFQKLWIVGSDPSKTDEAKAKKSVDNARRQFSVIDGLCGGRLIKARRTPTDYEMQEALCNNPMGIRVGVWIMSAEDDFGNAKTIEGNWVQQIASAQNGEKAVREQVANPPKAKVTAPKATQQKAPTYDLGDDEIPF